jgi:hypothetical protein
MVRATNIGPLDPVTEQKQMSTVYIEPDPFILTNLTTPMTSELEPYFAPNPSILANLDLATTFTISCIVSDKSRLENKLNISLMQERATYIPLLPLTTITDTPMTSDLEPDLGATGHSAVMIISNRNMDIYPPFTFPPDEILGIQDLYDINYKKVDKNTLLYIHSDHENDKRRFPPKFPKDSSLRFDVKLMGFKEKKNKV